MPRLSVAKLLLGAALLLHAGTAAASSENGIKIGEGRAHPFLELESRWDSNVFYASPVAPRGDLILHVRPGFTFSIPGQNAAVDFDALADLSMYSGVNNGSGLENPSDLNRVYANANLAVGLNRGGQVGLEVSDSFRRGDQTPSLSLAAAAVNNYNDLKLDVPLRPGGGALAVDLGGQWLLETFEPFVSGIYCQGAPSCDSANLSRFGYSQLTGRGEARWKFLPRTATVLEASYTARIPNDTTVALRVGGVKAQAGLAGLVTPHVAVTLKAGYGDTFRSAGVPYGTWLANVEGEYVLQDVGNLRVGYQHTYAFDTGARAFGLYGLHRLYADGKLRVGRRFNAKLLAEYGRLGYLPELQAQQVGESASILRFVPGVEMQVVRWAIAEVGYALTTRWSTIKDAAGDPLIPAFDYTKHEIWLKLSASY